jgi:hypothetical protein
MNWTRRSINAHHNGAKPEPQPRAEVDSLWMPTIDWTTATTEPAHHGAGDQLCVDVRGADAAWAVRFNEIAERHHRGGEVRGVRCGLIRYNEVEGHITVDDCAGDSDGPIRNYLTELVAEAAR